MRPRSTVEPGYTYAPAGPRDWRAAAMVWFGPAATPQQIDSFLLTTRHDETLARGWWVARRGDEVLAVQLVLPQAGAMAVCWPPTCKPGQQHQFTALWAAVRAAMRRRGVSLFQCLVPDNDLLSESLMTALGFRRITHLIAMRYRHDARRCAVREPLLRENVTPVAVDREMESAFEETLFATYAESWDAPEMDEYQRREDILAGYAAPHCRRWLLRDEPGRDVGALVLTEQDHVGQLNYLGVVPQARRRGVARAAVEWSLGYFCQHDVAHVMVRLDARNEPALRLYERSGFVESHRDVLFLAH